MNDLTRAPAIGFSEAILPNTVSQAMVKAFAHVAAERGYRVLAADANLDLARQQSDIARLVAEGVRAILVYPVGDPRELWPALDAVLEAGVYLFAHDDLEHPGVVSTMVTPVARMGAMAAEMLAERLRGRGDIVIVGGVPAPAIVERIAGFKEELAQHHPEMKIVAEVENLTDVEEGAEEVVRDLLATGVSFDGLFGYNDATAIGAASAIHAAGKTAAIVGNNGEPHGVDAVARGLLVGTVDRHPVELALLGATAMLDVVEGRRSPESVPAEITVDATPVTAENASRFVPWERRCPAPPAGSWAVI